jgi:hypothetical protein
MTTELDEPMRPMPLERAMTDEERAMASLVLELHAEFASVPLEQVSTLVTCLWSHYDSAPVRDFVALLVRKQAREELFDHLGPQPGAAVPPHGPPSPFGAPARPVP